MAWVRVATMADVPMLQELIDNSVRGLSSGFYSPAQIEAALVAVFGVDTQLLTDGTYYMIDSPSGALGIGGWSYRRNLYGGDQIKDGEDPALDPRTEPARIRAFFVRPDAARRGLARRLYDECARAAYARGFRHFELMATLPGVPLYSALGFSAVENVTLRMGEELTLPMVRMTRPIDSPLNRHDS
jgi:GNAT superfamily N-acetyltransferase